MQIWRCQSARRDAGGLSDKNKTAYPLVGYIEVHAAWIAGALLIMVGHILPCSSLGPCPALLGKFQGPRQGGQKALLTLPSMLCCDSSIGNSR